MLLTETYYAGIESYRKLRRLHWHSKLDSHVQIRKGIQLWVSKADNSIGKLSRQCRLNSTGDVTLKTR